MKILFETIVGSHAYGTNIETSDIDIKGIYIQPNSELLGLPIFLSPQKNIDKDTTYYEIGRFIQLLLSANPTVLEMLFVDDKFVKTKNPILNGLFENRHIFLTKECRNSFVGYAVAQIKKARGLNKKGNWEKERVIRKTPLDFCTIWVNGKTHNLSEFLNTNELLQENCGLTHCNQMKDCYSLYHSKEFDYRGLVFEESNHLRLSSIPKGEDSLGVILYNQDGYSLHCKEYKQYQEWLENRNVERYKESNDDKGIIDVKNMMHCMRLILCAKEIAETGNLTVYRKERDYLLNIRRGECNLETLLEDAEKELFIVDELFKTSNLPNAVDINTVNNLLLNIRNERNNN